MKFFSVRQTLRCRMHKFQSKVINVAKGVKKPGLQFQLDCRLSQEQINQFPIRFQSFLNIRDFDKEKGYAKRMDPEFGMSASIRAYSAVSGELKLERGFTESDPFRMELDRMFHDSDGPVLRMKFTGLFSKRAWEWGGELLEDGDIALEIIPFEAKLIEVGDDDEEEDADVEDREAVASGE